MNITFKNDTNLCLWSTYYMPDTVLSALHGLTHWIITILGAKYQYCCPRFTDEKMDNNLLISDRGWDGWMASLTRWTWVWVNSGSWWWTGRPGMLLSMVLQRVGHNWATELNWTTNQQSLANYTTKQKSVQKSLNISPKRMSKCLINIKRYCTSGVTKVMKIKAPIVEDDIFVI